MLEKLVKASGDKLVEGYIRYKKIRTCTGYREAVKKANLSLSKIKGGRILESGGYAAVLSFRWIILIIFLLLFLIFALIYSLSTQGLVREDYEPTYNIEPYSEISIAGEIDSEQLYIQVYGYDDIVMTKDNHILEFCNPEGNQCVTKVDIYVQDILVGTTDYIPQGQSEMLDIYDMLEQGIYQMRIVTRNFSEDKETEYNSANQTVKLTVV